MKILREVTFPEKKGFKSIRGFWTVKLLTKDNKGLNKVVDAKLAQADHINPSAKHRRLVLISYILIIKDIEPFFLNQ